MKKIYAILLATFLLSGVCPIPLYAARTVTASTNTENDTDIFDLTDGEYAIDVTMTGGSGKATIQSPTLLTLNDGIAYATITWSSSNYDYMIVDGQKYLNESEEDANSHFTIPIADLTQDVPVIADTLAMGTPHEVQYVLTFEPGFHCIKKHPPTGRCQTCADHGRCHYYWRWNPEPFCQ